MDRQYDCIHVNNENEMAQKNEESYMNLGQ